MQIREYVRVNKTKVQLRKTKLVERKRRRESTHRVHLEEEKSVLKANFSLFNTSYLRDSKRGKGHEKKFSGIKGNKMSWLKHYIHDEPEPRKSTDRCHGYGQKHQQIPSWIPPKIGSIWNPLAWRCQLQHTGWRGF